jgi:Tfp pilus assembly protein PilN
MKKMPHIDFALDRAAQQRRIHIAWAGLGLLLGIQVGVAAWRVQDTHASQKNLQQQYQQKHGHTMRAETATLTAEQRKAIVQTQQMLQSMSVPWDALLHSIEAARPVPVILETLQPNLETGTLKITATAPHFESLAEFVRELRQQAPLHDVHLESQALPESGAGSLRAVIFAQWRRAP